MQDFVIIIALLVVLVTPLRQVSVVGIFSFWNSSLIRRISHKKRSVSFKS